MKEKDLVYAVLIFDEDEEPVLLNLQVEKAMPDEEAGLCHLVGEEQMKFYILEEYASLTPSGAWENFKKTLFDQIKEIENKICYVDNKIKELQKD